MKHKSILSERKITKEKTYLEYTIHRRWPRSPESNGRKQHKPITMVPSMSNHDGAIVADSDIIYAYNKKLFVWSQTKWSKIKEDALSFTEDFRNTYNESSVGDNWNKIKRCINDSLTSHVPVKTSPGKQINSWITYELRWKTRKKKHRLYKKAKATSDPVGWKQFQDGQKSNKGEISKARVKFINERVVGNIEGGDTKSLWHYMKFLPMTGHFQSAGP